MWFGIDFIPTAEREDGGRDDLAIVHVYQRDRLFTIGGETKSLPQILTVLRIALYDSAVSMPRCRGCGHAIEAPDIDQLEDPCASA